jgi:hypothetical protein
MILQVRNGSQQRTSRVAHGLVLLLGLVAFGGVCTLAKAQEPPLLPAGTTVSVAGTAVSCAVQATSLTCAKKGGLSVTVNSAGVVQVSKTSKPSSAVTSGHRVLGPNGGFVTYNSSIYCHVYVQGARIMSCYKETTPKGGDKGSNGFDISNVNVVVFRFPQVGVRQDVKTIPQP